VVTVAAGEHPTFCRPRRRTWVRTNQNGLQTGVFFGTADDRPGASPESVRPDADAQADCARKKALQILTFPRAADGIRTHDLLHGKQNVCFLFGADIPCKRDRSGVSMPCSGSPAFTGSSRGFRHPRGTRCEPPEPGNGRRRAEGSRPEVRGVSRRARPPPGRSPQPTTRCDPRDSSVSRRVSHKPLLRRLFCLA
jgi:hypothetical protein